MKATGVMLIGTNSSNLIQTGDLKMVISSPRRRAIQTRDLLLESLSSDEKTNIQFHIDDDIREWDYGDYEGLKTTEILKLRESRGLGPDWDIWSKGCENGEDYIQVTKRVDAVIDRIRAVHKKALEASQACDVLVVGHGHILRCFAARWLKREINQNPQLILDAGGVGVLSYQHNNINEPALSLSGAFVVNDDDVR
ncbi:hypothetical protein KL930_005323 [Ogataea haglerorum]|uniref:Sedoheptulose 1,7-bisphosphatase n=1 Tax=Ogataea haglerorum TaxID=1937702 RepID=A0AAN6D1L5_9ASCO|nr:uncharacterized protein KL911_002358 [Ogataea haglerorum]KAG7696367.1 hypothetical protein KL915_002731 [Ogataea haglerorum]KAG7696739.1 hypothetical protein KL951_003195 [Ogataea haglerorum]KAG7706817.1 hypothetical protein KL914_002701 [Ogataea haglerorum]KAG7708876.1 hypothetical protein KL950_002396 [Ogataea haglerorum]KAG7716371.1 hypothetical protein KL913_003582 [Ogataea haglerorum]